MKKILFFIIIVFAGVTTVSAQKQQGRWVQCVDPNSGHTVQCFIPDGQRQTQPRRVVTYNQQPAVHQAMPYEPVYQTQTVRNTQVDYDVGLSPWSGRPYGRYTRRTTRTVITIETNSPNYRPNIYVGNNGYYSSGYPNW